MKEVCIWVVAMVFVIFAIQYAHQIHRRQIQPTLSTWIIFLVGTGLSLATYAVAEKHDFRSGILNLMDFASVATIVVAIVGWSQRSIRFKPFEWGYLVVAGAITCYGLLSGDAWHSNLFTQALITLGYIPTVQNLLKEKRNVESFTGWGCGLAAGIVGLYPALTDGNTLAAIYAVRTIVSVSVIIAIMSYFKFHPKRE